MARLEIWTTEGVERLLRLFMPGSFETTHENERLAFCREEMVVRGRIELPT
jgi:hypothetical protein